jgi:hypothetical protein
MIMKECLMVQEWEKQLGEVGEMESPQLEAGGGTRVPVWELLQLCIRKSKQLQKSTLTELPIAQGSNNTL